MILFADTFFFPLCLDPSLPSLLYIEPRVDIENKRKKRTALGKKESKAKQQN